MMPETKRKITLDDSCPADGIYETTLHFGSAVAKLANGANIPTEPYLTCHPSYWESMTEGEKQEFELAGRMPA